MVRYEDPAGDGREGPGPDILAVTLTRVDPGTVVVAVTFAADPPLTSSEAEGWVDALMVGIWTDLTGIPPEFMTAVHGYDPTVTSPGMKAPLVDMVAGPDEDRFIWDAVGVAIAGPTVALRLEAATLGDPDRIFLSFVSGREDAEKGGGTNVDYMPDPLVYLSEGVDWSKTVSIPWDFTTEAAGG